MSQLLRTEAEWNDAGFVVSFKEVSYHIDKHGNPLWRADQVETPYTEEDPVLESEDLVEFDES